MSQPNAIVRTMIAQFCGTTNRLVTMLGTKHLLFDNDTNMVKFDFKMCRKANYCIIRYIRSKDTYSMEFGKFDRLAIEWKTIQKFDDVYCDQLTEIFEEFTGLLLGYSPQFISR